MRDRFRLDYPAAVRITIWILVGGLVGALLAAAIGLAGLDFYARHALARLADSNLPEGEVRSEALSRTFVDLNALTMVPCSEEHLSAMRALVFGSNFIHDIAYVNDGRLICSSGLGTRVQTIRRREPPDFITAGGISIRRNIELFYAPGIRLTAVEEGHYSLLVTPIPYPTFVDSSYIRMSVMLVNRRTGTTLVYSGPDRHLDVALLKDGAILSRNNEMMAVACISSGTSCVVLSRKWNSLFVQYWSVLILIFAFGWFLGCVISGSFCAHREYSRSLPVQLRKAIARNELFVHYQPIVDTSTGMIVSAEALMRWVLPNGESVPPNLFIPAAEQAGFIDRLTRLAVENVTRDLVDILQEHETFLVSINITSNDLADPLFHATLQENVVGRGIHPSQIALEITERSAAEASMEIEATHHLHAQGYEIFIDDFGTGYSNISYLNTLAAQKLKLDKSFTDAVCEDSMRSRLVPPILMMAQELGLAVVVEGVETEDQIRYFQARGVYLMQGWFLAKAMPIEELTFRLNQKLPLIPGCRAS